MNIAIILAAGQGTRFGGQKILAPLQGKPTLWWSIQTFSAHSEIDTILVVTAKKYREEIEGIAQQFPKVGHILLGGNTRFESAQNGGKFFTGNKKDLLIFHNAANPLVTATEISASIEAAQKIGASGVGRKITSTLRKIEGENSNSCLIQNSQVLPRENTYAMETPQVLRADIFQDGIQKWEKEHTIPPTDDLQLAEIMGITPQIIQATPQNRKITTLDDLFLLESLKKSCEFRTGIGEDSHRFSEQEKPCMLGGIHIPNCLGFSGNSDGDVALHALCNAISSALGRNSFSTISDPMWKQGITDSAQYVQYFMDLLTEKNACIQNVTFVFEGKKPKLEPHFPKMKKRLSELLSIDQDGIGLTAHSGEKLTSFGKGEGVRVLASILIKIFSRV